MMNHKTLPRSIKPIDPAEKRFGTSADSLRARHPKTPEQSNQTTDEDKNNTQSLYLNNPDLGKLPYRNFNRDQCIVRLYVDKSNLNIELKPGINKIGRQRTNNHIVLSSAEVSRFHAEILIEQNEIILRDLKSANGSFVNQQKISESRLKAGDVINFSKDFTFEVLVDIKTLPPQSRTYDKNDFHFFQKTKKDIQPTSNNPKKEQCRFTDIIETHRYLIRPYRDAIFERSKETKPIEILKDEIPIDPQPAMKATSSQFHSAQTQTYPAVGYLNKESKPCASDENRTSGERMRSTDVYQTYSPADTRIKALLQISKQTMNVTSFGDLDYFLLSAIERIISGQRSFVAYQLPDGNWKFALNRSDDRWSKDFFSATLKRALALDENEFLPHSPLLNAQSNEEIQNHAHYLLPLKHGMKGAIFITAPTETFDAATLEFLGHFSDITTLALRKLFVQSTQE